MQFSSCTCQNHLQQPSGGADEQEEFPDRGNATAGLQLVLTGTLCAARAFGRACAESPPCLYLLSCAQTNHNGGKESGVHPVSITCFRVLSCAVDVNVQQFLQISCDPCVLVRSVRRTVSAPGNCLSFGSSA